MIDTWTADLPHGITLSCRSAGARGRPVLLFLHGFPEAAFAWDELLVHFARPEHGGYRCVAPNLRGYEHSSSPADVAAYHPGNCCRTSQPSASRNVLKAANWPRWWRTTGAAPWPGTWPPRSPR